MNAHPTEQLSEYIDDELTPAARASLEAHLSTCRACSALLAELRAVVTAARGAAEEPPTWDLWPGIARRLAPRSRGPQVVAMDSYRARRFSFSIPQLAAASIAVALVSAGAVWFALQGGGDPLAPRAATGGDTPVTAVADAGADPRFAEYQAAVDDLERLLDELGDRIDPESRDAIDQNLAIIDEAIGQIRGALEADPDDAYLNTHLASTLQRKIDVLQDATRLARTST